MFSNIAMHRKKMINPDQQAREMMLKLGITLDEAKDYVKKGQKSLSSFR